jgi:hypothetical protein
MAMIRKGQIRKIGGRDIRGQAIFITALFDTAAQRRSDPVYPRPPIFCDRLCNRALQCEGALWKGASAPGGRNMLPREHLDIKGVGFDLVRRK